MVTHQDNKHPSDVNPFVWMFIFKPNFNSNGFALSVCHVTKQTMLCVFYDQEMCLARKLSFDT